VDAFSLIHLFETNSWDPNLNKVGLCGAILIKSKRTCELFLTNPWNRWCARHDL